jgi:hypothetical protein
MKANRIVIILSGLFLTCVLLIFIIPQVVLNRYWKKIDQFTQKERYKSALDYALKAKQLSHQWGLKPAYVKSLLYEVKCKSKLNTSEEELIKLLRLEKDTHPTPVKEIVSCLYLEKLWNYYFHHRQWRDNQTFLDNSNDVSAWSSKRLIREIVYNIDELRKMTKLRFISFPEYQKQICSFSDNQIKFSTVYEFITWHSIEMLHWSSRLIYDDFVNQGYTEHFFVPLKDFLKIPIVHTDTFDLRTASMVLYQDLLRFQTSNHRPMITYEIELQRLNCLRDQYGPEDADEKYVKIIRNYRESVTDKDTRLLLDYALLNEYDAQQKINDLKKKCFEIIHTYPEWKAEVKECKQRWQILSGKTLNFFAGNVYDKNALIDITVAAENTDTAYANLYKLQTIYNTGQDVKIETDSAYNFFTGNCIDKKLIVFKNEFARTDKKKVTWGKLKTGTYLVAVGYKKDMDVYANVVKWQVLKVSGLAGYTFDNLGQTDIYAVKRKNGEPVKHASVTIFPRNQRAPTYFTDKWGKIIVTNSFLTDKIQIAFEGDTLLCDAGYHNHYYSSDEGQQTENVTIFTDRAVYRPSQKIYFKGILDKCITAQNRYTPVTNRKVHICFKSYDFTYGETEVTTNDFGSFSGSFVIPSKFPLGEMEISTKYGGRYVQVEEYKPTKMRLMVLPYQQPISMGDSIIITGYAKYLNGLPARNLPVSFSVRQDTRNQWRYLGGMVVNSGRVFSDQMGRFNIKIKTTPLTNDPKSQFDYEYVFSLECKDEFGEIQNETCSVVVGNQSCEATLKIDEYLLKRPVMKIPVEFSYNEHLVSPQKCRLTIYKLQPGPVKTKYKPADRTFYRGGSGVTFDSLRKEKIVFDKTLLCDKNYEFDATVLGKEEPGFYVAEVLALLNGKIHISQQKYFTLFDNITTGIKLDIENYFIPFSTEAKPGESVSFLAGSALPDMYGFFVISKNGHIIHQEQVHLAQNQQLFNIPVTEKYMGGFKVTFIGYANGTFYEQTHLIKVPFDNKKLHISFNSFRDNLYPGQQETWQLNIRESNGKPAKAEMVATLYDQALDEIKPNHYYYFPYSGLEEPEYSDEGWSEIYSDAIAGQGHSKNADMGTLPPPVYRSTFGNVSFFPTINWEMDKKKRGRAVLFYRSSSDKVCCDKTKVCASRVSYENLANISAVDVPPPPLKATIKFTPPDVMGEEVPEEDNAYPKEKVPVFSKTRKDFRETAFFLPYIRTDDNGRATVNFTMPDALTRWQMQGFAHTKDMKTGTVTNELVTQKDIMVIPNWPRFLRSGDTILLNIRIENNTIKTIVGNTRLEIQDASNLRPVTGSIISPGTSQKYSIKGRGNSFVQWKLFVPQNIHALLFRVKACSGASADGEEMLLPVMPNKELVTEALPIFIHGNEQKTFRLTGLTKQNIEDKQNYKYVFEFTPNPKWNIINTLAYLAGYPYDCAEQTFDKYFACCLAEHISRHNSLVNQFFNHTGKTMPEAMMSALEANPDVKSCLLEETPWMFDAKTGTGTLQKIAALFNSKDIEEKKNDLLEKLENFQNTDGGIAWFMGMKSSHYISWYLLEALGKINKLGELHSFEKQQPQFLKNLIDYCDNILVTWHQQVIKRKQAVVTMDQNLFVDYAYARSYFLKDYPLSLQKKEAYQYLLGRFRTQWQKSYPFQRPMMALILYRNQDYLTSNQIIESIKEMAVKDPEKGMFWSTKQNVYDYYSQIDNQAFTLELFVETHQDQHDIDEMENWLYLQCKDNKWSSTITTARACYSLLLPNKGKVSVSAGTFKLDIGQHIFSTNGSITSANPCGYLRKSWEASRISPDMANIKVKSLSNTNTVAWGAVYWQYFQKMGKGKETGSDLWIKKQYFIQRDKGYQPIGDREKVRVGDELIVRLDFGTDKNMSYVHIKDMRPTCLEPLSKISGCNYQDGLYYFESIRDASQNFFVESLPVGKHLIEYKVRVTHSGYFQTGNASIQCMYAPEYIGYSGSENICVN